MLAPLPRSKAYERHLRLRRTLAAPPERVFAALDDPNRLGRHMLRPSAMMLGGSMAYDLGPEDGRGIGARLDFKGSVLGLVIEARQRVIDYDPPRRKVWETAPEVRLLVIGRYRLGFVVSAAQEGSLLDVFIDYDLPQGVLGRLAGWILGGVYARWCLTSIARDAAGILRA